LSMRCPDMIVVMLIFDALCSYVTLLMYFVMPMDSCDLQLFTIVIVCTLNFKIYFVQKCLNSHIDSNKHYLRFFDDLCLEMTFFTVVSIWKIYRVQ